MVACFGIGPSASPNDGSLRQEEKGIQVNFKTVLGKFTGQENSYKSLNSVESIKLSSDQLNTNLINKQIIML